MKIDVAIIGGGPGGTSASMFLNQQGISSCIIEKDDFPRPHIGESMTGECGAIIRSLGLEHRMQELNFPVKRGLTVYGTGGKNSWFVPVMGRDQEWNLFPQFTWQVRREEFDKMMLEEALMRGAELIRGQAIEPFQNEAGAVRGIRVKMKDGGIQDVEAEVVLDCSGLSTFFANTGVTGPKYRGNYDRQIAIYSQIVDAVRDEGDRKDDTLIFYRNKYHWAWFIPLSDERVSVGVVIPSSYFQDKGETKEEFLARELSELNPELVKRVPEVKLVQDPRTIVNYSYQVREFTGPGYIAIGDAHRFIDPIFSFGLFVSMKEAQFASHAVADYLNGIDRDLPNPFAKHMEYCDRGIDIVEDFIDTFWEQPIAFSLFMHVRYFDLMIDALAGRVYENQPSKVVRSMRKLLKRDREEEGMEDLPIGSRYHPERAEIGLEDYHLSEEN